MINRRSFLKSVSQGAIALTVAPSTLSIPQSKAIGTVQVGDQINKVHVVFKEHLDIGYTTSARKVTKNLWDWKIPTLISTARILEKENIKVCFNYGAWVIYDALEKSKGKRLQDLEKAIADDIITWNAMPHTPESEYCNDSIFASMLDIFQTLDSRFAKKTIAAKLTDVPGQSIAIVPYLAKAGIKFLHVGVNWASASPEVPNAFIWKHPDGSEITVMYCPGGYGKAQTFEGHNEVLGLCMKGDNMDPWTPAEVREAMLNLQKTYPGAEMIGSSLNNFALSLENYKKKLPVITHEIGDTWIYGMGTDPTKTARFRELSRLHQQWLAKGETDKKSLEKFSIYMGLVGEHTWGMDHNTYLDDYTNIPNDKFHALRQRSNFRIMEESWNEQREYMDMAIESLPENIAQQAIEKTNQLKPAKPDLSAYSEIKDLSKEIDTNFFKIKIGKNGEIISLLEKAKRRQWFDAQHPLGLFRYQTFSGNDLYAYDSKYWRAGGDTPIKDYDEYSKIGGKSQMIQAQLIKAYSFSDKSGLNIICETTLPDECIKLYGGSKQQFIHYHFATDKPSVSITFQWFDKTATRFREASWLSMVPITNPADTWRMEKIGSMLSPINVVMNGNRSLHGIWEKIQCQSGKSILNLISLDACLFSPGRPAAYDFSNQLPDMKGGIHYNLHNNLWGTNFPAWFEDDAKFRFQIEFS